jgi:ketosteroid isomerase-like protein
MRRATATVVLLTLAACAPKAAETVDSTTPPAAVAATDTKADADSVRALSKRWLELANARDSVGISRLFADDGYEYVSNAPAAKGPADVAKALGPQFRPKDLKDTFETSDVVVAASGDLAVERGTYHVSYTDAKGKHVDDHGNYITTWKKVGGQWKVLHDISASEVPAPGR